MDDEAPRSEPAAPTVPRLSTVELARRAATTPERVQLLVEIGVLQPDGATFAPADAQRIAIVDAYERSGIELGHLAHAIREGRMSFEFTDRIYPEASPPSGRTVADLEAELGPRGAVLHDLLLSLGLPAPTPDRPLTEMDARVLPALIDAWTAAPIAPDALLRAARLLGQTARRVTEGWVELFLESVGLTSHASARLTVEELGDQLLRPAMPVAQALEPVLLWLVRRHLAQTLNAVNVEAMEHALEAEGIRPRATDLPAIVFADISGFTRLTEELGDEAAASHAMSLAHIATTTAAGNGGRFVKQLGDGVMLAFTAVGPAIAAALALRDGARAAALPPLHAGISAGPLIERDGDYFGRTVNLAARISAVAGPGEIVLDEAAATASGRPDLTALGPVELKGITTATALFRLDAPA